MTGYVPRALVTGHGNTLPAWHASTFSKRAPRFSLSGPPVGAGGLPLPMEVTAGGDSPGPCYGLLLRALAATMRSAPAFTLGVRRGGTQVAASRGVKDGPGPGAYTPQGADLPQAPKYSIGTKAASELEQRWRERAGADGPGPGEYVVQPGALQDPNGPKAKGGAFGERVGFGSTFAAADASAREGGGGRFVHADAHGNLAGTANAEAGWGADFALGHGYAWGQAKGAAMGCRLQKGGIYDPAFVPGTIGPGGGAYNIRGIEDSAHGVSAAAGAAPFGHAKRFVEVKAEEQSLHEAAGTVSRHVERKFTSFGAQASSRHTGDSNRAFTMAGRVPDPNAPERTTSTKNASLLGQQSSNGEQKDARLRTNPSAHFAHPEHGMKLLRLRGDVDGATGRVLEPGPQSYSPSRVVSKGRSGGNGVYGAGPIGSSGNLFGTQSADFKQRLLRARKARAGRYR